MTTNTGKREQKRATEFFDPTIFSGDVVPAALRRWPKLGPGPKALYGRLMALARRGAGEVYPSQVTLAEDLGTNRRQIQRWSEELQKAGLVKYEAPTGNQRIRHLNGTYRFLPHPIFDPTIPPDDQGRNLGPHDAQVSVRDTEEPLGDKLSPPQATDSSVDEATERRVLVGKEFVENYTSPTPPAGAGGELSQDQLDQHHHSLPAVPGPNHPQPVTPDPADHRAPDDLFSAAGAETVTPETMDPVLRVWNAHQAARAHVTPGASTQRLTDKRRRLITNRIKSHGFQAVLDAVIGWTADDWASGRARNAPKVFGDEIEFVLRVGQSGDRVERHAALADGVRRAHAARKRADAERDAARRQRDADIERVEQVSMEDRRAARLAAAEAGGGVASLAIRRAAERTSRDIREVE